MNYFELRKDPAVKKCMFDLYMLLLVGTYHPEFEVLLEEFCNEFRKLSEEKQKIIKIECFKAIKENEKNIKEGEKKL